jgi:hypothetical protein
LLQAARLFPIAVFIRPLSVGFIRTISDEGMSDEQAEKVLIFVLTTETDDQVESPWIQSVAPGLIIYFSELFTILG